MALLKYFKSSLPTAKDTGMSEIATREANAAVSRVMTPPQQTSRKRKAYSIFSDEQRATIGKYAAENGNAVAVKKFKDDFDGGLGESTVRAFKKRYLEELKKATKENLPGEVPKVELKHLVLWLPLPPRNQTMIPLHQMMMTGIELS